MQFHHGSLLEVVKMDKFDCAGGNLRRPPAVQG